MVGEGVVVAVVGVVVEVVVVVVVDVVDVVAAGLHCANSVKPAV